MLITTLKINTDNSPVLKLWYYHFFFLNYILEVSNLFSLYGTGMQK